MKLKCEGLLVYVKNETLLKKREFLAKFMYIQAIYELIGEDTEQPERQIEADERAMNIFRMMDKNSDGVLSREEFVDGCLNDEQLYQLLTQSSRFGDNTHGSQSSLDD